MRDILSITKALADPNRLRVLYALRNGELCVCQITELLGLAQSTVSKHMAILHQARLVENRKDGRWIYYRLPGNNASAEVQDAISWVCANLEKSPDIREDVERLNEILKLDPEKLCKKQSGS
ncbi:MAG: winged helix-turn-helix transcriptional regulator [Planctomycetes bacterium]|nr:winged helix-turn-helix transcriptional regulator [Planctomycetota bacterium]